MEYVPSILFTRSLDKGEGAAAQEAEIKKVVSADAAEKAKSELKLISVCPIGGAKDSGMLTLLASYVKCDCNEKINLPAGMDEDEEDEDEEDGV